MEINAQQMDALLRLQEQQAQLPRKNLGGASFDALLSQQLNPAIDTLARREPALGGASQADMANRLLLGGEPENNELDPDSAVLMAAFDQASGALDMWDSYASALGRPGADLKDAWGLLEGIDAQIAQIKGSPARGQNSGLDAILNELEIMAATEKFKFNRGDYI